LKSLIILADSITPEYIIDKKGLFPHIEKLIDGGSSGRYSSYVQKGFNGSYSTLQNLVSISTGLPPTEHKMTQDLINKTHNGYDMAQLDPMMPLWKILGDNGLSVGLVGWCIFSKLSEINGYAIGHDIETVDEPCENRVVRHPMQYIGDENHTENFFGKFHDTVYPKTLKQQGYTFSELKADPKLAVKAVNDYCYEDGLDNFKDELDFFYDGIIKTQEKSPVDVIYFYTPTTDIIAHSCLCSDDNKTLIAAYKLLDDFIGKLTDALKPETTFVMSDHGQGNFKDLCECSDPKITREVFEARDDVIWFPNGYIAFEAHNGALLFSHHSLLGTFIASGNGIKHKTVEDMRTLDIYPTILEALGIKIPENRSGFIADIFSKPIKNAGRPEKPKTKQKIAFIQTHKMNICDICINELYIENRFCEITVVGEKKYSEVFLSNPRVRDFISFEDFNSEDFDEIYCGFYNETTGLMSNIKII
jgi:hypothetical protein